MLILENKNLMLKHSLYSFITVKLIYSFLPVVPSRGGEIGWKLRLKATWIPPAHPFFGGQSKVELLSLEDI
jgi:hypothetical protein